MLKSIYSLLLPLYINCIAWYNTIQCTQCTLDNMYMVMIRVDCVLYSCPNYRSLTDNYHWQLSWLTHLLVRTINTIAGCHGELTVTCSSLSLHGCLLSLAAHCHWLLIVTDCSLSLAAHYHWLLIVTGCSLSLTVHCHWLLIVTGCSVSLATHCNWQLIVTAWLIIVTDCSLSLAAHFHWLRIVPDCWVSLSAVCHCQRNDGFLSNISTSKFYQRNPPMSSWLFFFNSATLTVQEVKNNDWRDEVQQ